MDRRCFRPADPPPREAERLEALHRCEVLDTGPEPAFDDLTALASRAAGTPIALVSLIDEHRQWFKSRHGLEAHETPRDWAFCAHAIHGRDLMEVPDAARDARFAGNPLVVGAPHIRYYAGTPLVTPEGHALGTLCVIDRRPRRLSRAARDTLARLARQGAQLLELRLAQRRRAEVETRLRAQSAELSRMALVAQHTRHAAVLLDREGRIEWANRGFERTTGYTLDEARGRTVGELLSCAETDAATLERLRRAVREGTTARACIVNRRRDGTRFWSDVDLQPLTDEAGTPTGFVVMRTDVTALVQEREAAQAMLSALPVGVLVRDADAAIVEANPAAERIFGLPREQILSRELLERDLPTTDAAGRPVPRADRPAIRTLATGEALHDVPLTIRAADGALRHLTASIAPLHHADGRVAGVVTCLLDVTREREQQRLMAIAAGAAHFVPWWLNVQTWQVEFEVRPAAALGFVRADAGGEGGIARIAWWPTVHRDDAPVARAAIQRHLRGEDDRFRAEYRIRDAAGGWRWVQMSGSVTERDADGRPLWVAGLSRDIEERKRAEAALERAATRDELTGLPNRAVLRDRLRQAIAAARRRGAAGALLFIDLDHFKRVNDSLGHAAGDALLRAFAGRLQGALRAEDTLARMGGDEWVVLLPSLAAGLEAARAHALHVARKLVAAAAPPFDLGGVRWTVGLSVGASVFPKDGAETADDLLREADTAMYEAKAAGRVRCLVFEPAMQAAVSRRVALEHALKRALAAGEFTLALQPKWGREGNLLGAEALLRWAPPGQAPVSPAEFVPVAEDSGLIVPLGRWVLGEACRLMAARRAAGRPLPVAVNVSPRQFREPGFEAEVMALLAAHGTDPRDLTLELTEGLLIDDTQACARRMGALAAHGIRISVDDFGTGYSSLMYLKRLPIHELKIDRAFVRDLETDADDASIVQAMLSIAARFGLQTVAEGVETEAQAAWLRAHGCTMLQGFLLGRPVPEAEFVER